MTLLRLNDVCKFSENTFRNDENILNILGPALEELPSSQCPQGVLMELLGNLNHPYIYPILDLSFFHTPSHRYACLVMPLCQVGSLKDLIHKVSIKC